jgi:hypothetical protein
MLLFERLHKRTRLPNVLPHKYYSRPDDVLDQLYGLLLDVADEVGQHISLVAAAAAAAAAAGAAACAAVG